MDPGSNKEHVPGLCVFINHGQFYLNSRQAIMPQTLNSYPYDYALTTYALY